MKLSKILTFPPIGNTEDAKELISKFTKEKGTDNPFYEQAKALMSEYWIRKVSGGKTRYYFINEVELYYYGKGHEDRYVHPHFYTEAGRFRVHFSGVDITFAADWKGKEEEIRKQLEFPDKPFEYGEIAKVVERMGLSMNEFSYGGLLIRNIREEGGKATEGSWRVLCELFRMEGNSIELYLEKCDRRECSEPTIKKRENVASDDLKSYSFVELRKNSKSE